MTMAAVDLDPTFVKALKLLHSKSKDSMAQLRAMVDDAIAQRKGLKVKTYVFQYLSIYYILPLFRRSGYRLQKNTLYHKKIKTIRKLLRSKI